MSTRLTRTLVTAAGYEEPPAGGWVALEILEGPSAGMHIGMGWDGLNTANVCANWGGHGVRTLKDLVGREWRMKIRPLRDGRLICWPAYPPKDEIDGG